MKKKKAITICSSAAIGFHYKKPIYILNPISEEPGFKEEVFGMQPVFLNGDLGKIAL